MALSSLAPYRQKILDAAARRGARNVRVFGSVARGDDQPNSDIDLLVDVEPGRTLLDVIGLEQDLQEPGCREGSSATRQLYSRSSRERLNRI